MLEEGEQTRLRGPGDTDDDAYVTAHSRPPSQSQVQAQPARPAGLPGGFLLPSFLFRSKLAADNEGEDKTNEEDLPGNFVHWKLDELFDRARASNRTDTLRTIRDASIAWARRAREDGIWDAEVHGPTLRNIINYTRDKENHLKLTSGKALEPPELTRILREDKYHQHACDVKTCCRMTLGWLCVFFFCQIPWIIAIFLIGVQYRVSNSESGENGLPIGIRKEPQSVNMSTATQKACNQVADYLFGFFIVYCINIVIALVAALSRTVDNGDNTVVRYSSPFVAFASVTMLVYNLYGIIVIWNSAIWYEPVDRACDSLRVLCVIVLSFFFALPILCFILIRITGRKLSTPDDAKDSGEESLQQTQKQAAAVSTKPEQAQPSRLFTKQSQSQSPQNRNNSSGQSRKENLV